MSRWARQARRLLSHYLRRQVRSLFIVLIFLLLAFYFRHLVRTSGPYSAIATSLSPWLGGLADSYYSRGISRYYTHETSSQFPPLRHRHDGTPSPSQLCEGFPTHLLETIQIVIKTGVAESAKNKAHLATLSSCISNLIVFSDLEEQIGSHQVIDVLSDLPQSYRANNPDFDLYESQKTEHAKGNKIGKSKEGWKLDRFKFLPMVDRAYRMRPRAKWYVFLETDVYLFWDTLFRLLGQLDPEKPHYLGSPVGGSHGRWFAYGGSGFVLSQGLMTKLVGDGTWLGTVYEQMAKDDCCGDAVLAYAIVHKTGVRLEGLFPTFSGDELSMVKTDADSWCLPFLSLHRVSPEQMENLWMWERTRPYDEDPMYYSKVLSHTLSRLQFEDTWDYWDNFSDDPRPRFSSAHASAASCKAACFQRHDCLQYSYTAGTCKFGNFVRQGRPAKNKDEEFTSGWNTRSMQRLGFNISNINDTGCKRATWLKPTIR